MSYSFVFVDEANSDVEETYTYYFKISFELAERFLEQLNILLQTINSNPFLFQTFSGKKRRAPLNKFPFSVYYRVDNNIIAILAVLHDKRNPSIVRKRKNKN